MGNPTEPAVPCAKCGHVHERCAGHRRRPAGSTDPLRPCGSRPLKGKKVCRLHGGLTPVGPESANWRHGAYSQVLKGTPLAAGYEAARANGSLDMTDQIGLVDAKLLALLEEYRQGQSSSNWEQVGTLAHAIAEARVAMREAMRSKDIIGIDQAMKRQDQCVEDLRALAAGGMSSAATWDDVLRHLGVRKQLFDSEVKRRKDMHEMVARERVIGLLASVGQAIIDNVSSPAERAKVVGRIRDLVGAPIAFEARQLPPAD